jgi:hypothetical protein
VAIPKDILSPADYKNYRNVRAVAVLFIVFGTVLVLGGTALALGENPDPKEQIHPAAVFGIAIIGLAGTIGGIATLRGMRRWAPLMYVMAALYVFGFPVGTILSVVLFTGLRRYLQSVERLQAAQISDRL